MDILTMEVYRKPSDTGSGYKLWCIATPMHGQQIVVRFGHEDHALQQRISPKTHAAYHNKIDKKRTEGYERIGSYPVSDRVDYLGDPNAVQPKESPGQPAPQPAKASARDGLLYWAICALPPIATLPFKS